MQCKLDIISLFSTIDSRIKIHVIAHSARDNDINIRKKDDAICIRPRFRRKNHREVIM